MGVRRGGFCKVLGKKRRRHICGSSAHQYLHNSTSCELMYSRSSYLVHACPDSNNPPSQFQTLWLRLHIRICEVGNLQEAPTSQFPPNHLSLHRNQHHLAREPSLRRALICEAVTQLRALLSKSVPALRPKPPQQSLMPYTASDKSLFRCCTYEEG